VPNKFALPLLLVLALIRAELPAAEFDLQTASIADIDRAFAAGALTSERLTELCLARIRAYEPKLHAVLALNPAALAQARALDAERKAKGPRSPLHGIPVVLKDNYDTSDLPTTAGFYGLKGSVPARDATVVARLRAAGAIILAKVNLSEFATGSDMSSLGGQSHNPHALDFAPSGSSGGTGVAIAAAYAPLGFGTDTGGSIRGPSNANGIVGLKTTFALNSRAGIIPLALSLDTAGPMARSVTDIALSLNCTAGPDPRDAATAPNAGHVERDYTRFLDAGALKGARIGVARDFLGQDAEVDATFESALSAMKRQGAVLVDVKYPPALIKLQGDLYLLIRQTEFRWQIEDYLAGLKPGFPRTHAQIVELAERLMSPSPEGYRPDLGRLATYRAEAKAPALTDPVFVAQRDFGLGLMRATLLGLLKVNRLDAIVYPTASRRTARLDAVPPTPTVPPAPAAPSAGRMANLSGCPELVVPAGFTTNGLPIGISFFGAAFGEGRLLALGYAFEQATHSLRQPVNTPSLPGERFSY
jgi:amidase